MRKFSGTLGPATRSISISLVPPTGFPTSFARCKESVMAEQAVTATSGSTSKTSRLVISIDVGITQSAVAVAYLPPGIPNRSCYAFI